MSSLLRHRYHATWFLIVAVVLIAGCGQEKSTSPLNEPPDTSPPGVPTGLVVTAQTDTKFTLEWTPGVEPNIIGYNVYRYDPDPARVMSYVLVNQKPTPASRLTIAGTSGTTYYFRVTTVDITPKESEFSEPLSFTFQASGNGTQSGEDGTDNTTWRGDDETGSGHNGRQYQVGDLPIRR